MGIVVGLEKMIKRNVTVAKEIAAKHGWEASDQRMQRHLKASPTFRFYVQRELNKGKNDDKPTTSE